MEIEFGSTVCHNLNSKYLKIPLTIFISQAYMVATGNETLLCKMMKKLRLLVLEFKTYYFK